MQFYHVAIVQNVIMANQLAIINPLAPNAGCLELVEKIFMNFTGQTQHGIPLFQGIPLISGIVWIFRSLQFPQK